MSRGELLAVVRALRDERGPRDAAAHRLLTDVVCHQDRDAAAARAELLRRVKALRDERARTHDPVLLLLLAEVIAHLEREVRAARGPSRGYCEFCGTEDGGCAVCGGE
jgi:hypothetical protein